MTTHWTERSIEDFLFRIGADFIAQLEERMDSLNITQDKLSEALKVTKGRVSQVLNNPGNLTLKNVVKYSRALGIKVAIVAYDDNDPTNGLGPINSKIFTTSWEKIGKPKDFWELKGIGWKSGSYATTNMGYDFLVLNSVVKYGAKTTPDFLETNSKEAAATINEIVIPEDQLPSTA